MAHQQLRPSYVQMLIAYFDSLQDPKRDRPLKYVTIEEARQLVKVAKTHFFVLHGSAVSELPKTALTAAACERGALDVDGKPRKKRGNWIVVNQTAIPGTQKFRNTNSFGPGCPRYAFA
jgi:hypothetical protein